MINKVCRKHYYDLLFRGLPTYFSELGQNLDRNILIAGYKLNVALTVYGDETVNPVEVQGRGHKR